MNDAPERPVILPRHPPFARSFAIAVLLPLAIAAADYLLLFSSTETSARWPPRMQPWLCLQFAWYVLQVGLISYIVGHYMPHAVLRWIVFGWIMSLVTLLAVIAAMSDPYGLNFLPPAALVSGELGFMVVWMFFGDRAWQIRLPVTLVIGMILYFSWLSLQLFINTYSAVSWTLVLILQVIMLSILCGVMRGFGFRLQRLTKSGAVLNAKNSQRVLQFNLNHMLIWATSLGLLLAVVKSLDLLTWRFSAEEYSIAGLTWRITVATASGVGIIVALWAALGRESSLVRLSIGIFFLIMLGTILALWGKYTYFQANSRGLLRSAGWDWSLRSFYEIGWWWIGWFFLSGGILAAMLMILRTLDYRLVRLKSGA